MAASAAVSMSTAGRSARGMAGRPPSRFSRPAGARPRAAPPTARRAAATSGSSPRRASDRRRVAGGEAAGQMRLRTGRRERDADRLQRARASRASRSPPSRRGSPPARRGYGARSSTSACSRAMLLAIGPAGTSRASCRGVRNSARRGRSPARRRSPHRTARAASGARVRSTASRCSSTTNSITPGAAAVTAWKVGAREQPPRQERQPQEPAEV